MPEYATLAAVDLGSNSFRLQVARVVEDQIYPLDSLRETVRLAAGLTADEHLDEAAQQRALDCLQRFGERLRGFPQKAVRAVGTNTLRVAKNSAEFLRRAEAALGFPIEVVAGREEARLIYLGVAHSLPPSRDRRLVVDIGGGSTEFIIGSGLKPHKLESVYMGCVSHSLRFFPGGKIGKNSMKQAEIAARAELQAIAAEFSSAHWQEAAGSSGTARALTDILELNGWSESGITGEGLERLRAFLIKAGDSAGLSLPGLRPDRAPVLPGGFAIMAAVFSELGVRRMVPAAGAMRQGVLYDMLGRFHHRDMRDATVRQFMRRYHAGAAQAQRVEELALILFGQLGQAALPEQEDARRFVSWAAQLHEIGISVAHTGYHRHTAYIVSNADMPGFSRMEQKRLSLLLLAHRGSLDKMRGLIGGSEWNIVLALRLAVLFYRSRSAIALPALRLQAVKGGFRLALERDWVLRNPLTAAALTEEIGEWDGLGFEFRIAPFSAAG